MRLFQIPVFLWVSLFILMLNSKSALSFKLRVISRPARLSHVRSIATESIDASDLTKPTPSLDKVCRALEIYAKHFGECRIHSHFVVPQCPPWPPDIQGLRLGPALTKMLNNNDVPGAKEAINKLGFTIGSFLEGWDLFYDALSVFRNEFGHARVPANFVVPHSPPWPKLVWGLKLGAKVASLRTTGRYVRDHQERLKDLELLGFEWAPRELRRHDNIWGDEVFPRLVTALLIYRDLLPDREIPENFTVPRTSSWPVNLHDLPLGAMVRIAREARESSSFKPRIVDVDSTLDFDSFYSALKNFKALYQNCEVPRAFVVPEGNKEWPQHLYGYPLGEVLHSIQKDSTKLIPQQIHFLEALGVYFIENDERKLRRNQFMEPFDQTRQFDIPNDSEKIARSLTQLLRERTRSHDARVRRTALIEGSLSAEDYANVMSQKLTESELAHSQLLGYRILEFDRFQWSDVVRSLKAYRKEFGDLNVPDHFSVTPALLKRGFPTDSVGLALGNAVRAIRIGDVDALEDPLRLSELQSLGFEWGDRRKYLHFRFFPMWLGLKHYFYIFGNVVVPYDYIVPNSAEWPVWMTNMPLGKWTTSAKSQHLLLATEYPARKEALDAFEFDWSISPDIISIIRACEA